VFKKNRYFFLLFLSLTLLSTNSFADKLMNDIGFDQFGDFSKNWQLVTVRYRNDTREMRFTYATELAWKSLSKNVTNYPDGAVFAKVGYMTVVDSAFPSSATPQGARRVQYMIRDKKKYEDTNGWGYALFDNEGNTFPGDLKSRTQSCYMCHKIVPERGEVFSQIMGVTNDSNKFLDSWKKKNKFISIKRAALPLELLKILPTEIQEIKILDGSLSKNPFFGTLDEIRPLLVTELIKSKKASALIGPAETEMFSIALFDKNTVCPAEEIAIVSYHTIVFPKIQVIETKFCQGKN
jgi:hypothetical protein